MILDMVARTIGGRTIWCVANDNYKRGSIISIMASIALIVTPAHSESGHVSANVVEIMTCDSHQCTTPSGSEVVEPVEISTENGIIYAY